MKTRAKKPGQMILLITAFLVTGLPAVERADAKSSLMAATYLGGSGTDGQWPASVFAIDRQGFIYLTGMTSSEQFPVTPGSYDTTYNGGDSDIFVTKFSPGLNAIIASTFIGGSGHDSARSITIDEAGNLILAGNTESTDFPATPGAYDTDYNGGSEGPYGSGDVFIVRMNPELTEITACTYIGGSGHDVLNKIKLDAGNHIVIAGGTNSTDFPVSAGAFSTSIHSGGTYGDDAFVAIIEHDLSSLLASTYIGGNGDDYCEGLAIGHHGSIFVSGWTESTDYPTSDDAFDKDFNGYYYDGFVSKLDNNLVTLTASSYLGGSSWDFIYSMALDENDSVFVAGHTASTDFPVSSGAYDTTYNSQQGPNNGDDVFVTRMNDTLSGVTAGTYLGGSKWENAYGLSIDSAKGLFVFGSTSSPDFPVGTNCYQSQFHGGSKHSGDCFITNLDLNLTELKASTYLGGSDDDGGQWISLTSDQHLVVSGMTKSGDFPTTSFAYQQTFQGGSLDVIAASLDTNLSGDMDATPTPTPTASCSLGVRLSMPAHHFAPGVGCSCDVIVCNDTGSDLIAHPLFVILEAFDTYYFAPSFNTEFDNYLSRNPSFAPGETQVEILPAFDWPSGVGEADGLMWYAGLTDPGITALIGNYDYWEFGWSDIPGYTPTPVPPTATPEPTAIPMNLILLPGGSFEMGTPLDELCREPDEILFAVTLSRSFYVLQTEVTQAQWMEIFSVNPSFFSGQDHPVEKVTWFDACIYCNRLSEREQLTPCYYTDVAYTTVFDGTPPVVEGTVFWNRAADGFRLPTEAEWEYACRAGTTTAYNSGEASLACDTDPNLDPLDWYKSNSNTGNGRETHPVGTKLPNGWNIYQMHGNVGEWCWDWHGDYPSGSATDPEGPDTGTERINRGGAFNYIAGYCRSGNRWFDDPGAIFNYYGFRIVRNGP